LYSLPIGGKATKVGAIGSSSTPTYLHPRSFGVKGSNAFFIDFTTFHGSVSSPHKTFFESPYSPSITKSIGKVPSWVAE
jgi:hypothetical protein